MQKKQISPCPIAYALEWRTWWTRKNYLGMLNDRVVFYKSELSDDSAFVIQTGGEREVAMERNG